MNSQPLKIPRKNLADKITETLSKYIKTQFLVFIVVTAFTWIILFLLGIKYALLLAFVSGSLSMIPLVGMITAAFITGTVAVFDGMSFLNGVNPVFEGFIVFIIYIILNQLIDIFLTPYVMGKMFKMNPLVVVLSVIIGTWIFGIAGAVLTVPVLLVARTVLNHFSKK